MLAPLLSILEGPVLIDPLPNDIEAGERDFTLADVDSQKACRDGSVVLHGWSLRRACKLTGAVPATVQPKMQSPGQLTPVPTPETIVSMCKEFRLISDRKRC
jgi:hypothetical protein